MARQSQRAGDFSDNIQAEILHVGDNIYVQPELLEGAGQHTKGINSQADYVPIFSPDRYVEETANGMFYSIFAKDAVATDITHFEKKLPGSNETERRITIRFVGARGERFPLFLSGNHEPPCAAGSPVVVTEARDCKGELLSCGVWEKGIRWNYYPSLPFLKRWKFLRAKEHIAITAVCAVLGLLWFLRVHFDFYYELSQSITTTKILFFASAFAISAVFQSPQIREMKIRRRMEQFACAGSGEVSSDHGADHP